MISIHHNTSLILTVNYSELSSSKPPQHTDYALITLSVLALSRSRYTKLRPSLFCNRLLPAKGTPKSNTFSLNLYQGKQKRAGGLLKATLVT